MLVYKLVIFYVTTVKNLVALQWYNEYYFHKTGLQRAIGGPELRVVAGRLVAFALKKVYKYIKWK